MFLGHTDPVARQNSNEPTRRDLAARNMPRSGSSRREARQGAPQERWMDLQNAVSSVATFRRIMSGGFDEDRPEMLLRPLKASRAKARPWIHVQIRARGRQEMVDARMIVLS